MKEALVVLSGGQDSATCLFLASKEFDKVHAITFDYGQRHKIEIKAAQTVASLIPNLVSHRIVKLDTQESYTDSELQHYLDLGSRKILQGASPLISDNHLEQYSGHDALPGGLEKTFVPMRNQLFLTLAANRAYAVGINTLVTGVCQEDSGGYPDCTQGFIDSFVKTSSLGTFTDEPGLRVWTPLMDLTKAESVNLALSIPGCYEALAFTHTSYDGAYPPTGSDHATLLRAKGFEEAGVPDPLVMRAWASGLMELPKTDNYGDASVLICMDMLAPYNITKK